MSWLAELEREVRATGIPPARRRRIVAELADHLAVDPEAEGRLGDPAELARRFADELGTALARRAAYGVFLALAPFGLLFVSLFAFGSLYTTNVPPVLTAAIVIGVQLAFVGGALAPLRAWRLRGLAVMPGGEARILLRRTGLALAGGALTVAALGLLVSGYYPGVQWWAPALAWATVAAGGAALVLGAGAVVGSARLLPAADGPSGDLAFDLGLRADPWHIAYAVAAAVVLCIAAAGVVQLDPLDGLVRAVGDGALCLAGFALLGRPLGLRR